MKFVFFIIGGLIFGGFSNDAWGVWVGGLLGFLVAWITSLSDKISQLEAELTRRAVKPKIKPEVEPEDAVQYTYSPATSQPVEPTPSEQHPDNERDGDATEAVALQVNQVESEPMLEQHTPAKTEALDETAVEQATDSPQTSAADPDAPQSSAVADTHQNRDVEPEKSADSTVQPAPSAFELMLSQGVGKIKSLVVGYFTGGNSLVRAGMLVLFVGVAFLLKYVAERTVVPIEVRYVGIVLGSLVLLVLGWRLRHKRAGFALSLQGGGIGVLYLTLFAAMRLHQLLPPSVVLLCLIGIVVLSATLAVLQNSMALAVIGILGGFAAPILTSTGSGSHVQLFAYYLLLNFSIFGIAWFKSWRLLNVVGFISTFAVGSVWGAKFYQPQFFASVEPFLVAHFLLYVVIAVLFAFKQPPKLKGINDGTIIFGTPIVAFSLQAALVKDMPYGLAYSALILGVFYVAVAYLIKTLHRPFFKDLIESFIALGVGFGTLAIPLGFDGRVTSAMWVAEASALVWVGIKQSRILPRFSGYALALLGSMAFFVEPEVSKDVLVFLNADFIGVVIIVLATAFMGLYARHHQDRLLSIETPWVAHLMLLAAVVWWVLGGLHEIDKHFRASAYFIQQLWMLLTTLVLIIGAKKLTYPLLMRCALAVNAAMWPLLLYIKRFSIEQTLFLNERFLGLAVVAVFYIGMSVFWAKYFADEQQTVKKANVQKNWISRYFLAAGVVTWLFAMLYDINKFIPEEQLLWMELMLASSAAVLLFLGHKYKWPDFKWAALGVVLVMALPVHLTFVSSSLQFVPTVNPMPIFNLACLSLLVYALTHFLMSRYWTVHMLKASELSKQISSILLILSLLMWFINGVREAQAFLNVPHWLPAVLVFISASWLLLVWLAHRLDWSDLHQIKFLLTPVLVYVVIFTPTVQTYHASFGPLAWLMLFAVNYWLLRIYDHKLGTISHAFHAVSLFSVSLLLVYELAQLIEWRLGTGNIFYSSAATVTLLLVMGLVFALRDRINWPLIAHRVAYFYWALPLMMVVQWLLLLFLNLSHPGSLSGVPYLPLLNVIDVVGVSTLYLAFRMQQTKHTKLFIADKRIRYSLFALMGFLLLNASMLRCFHYWYGIDYQLGDLMSSFMVQTGFSILWAATAVALMVLAAHKKWRQLWLLGLGLMIVVVAKLFLVDMSASGSIERIVAFLSVGFLLSVVGYFSPLPPEIKPASDAADIDNKEMEREHG